ncbi:hypothetical protein BJY52DRAFT_1291857 [Lactarius psammicola]|nr:hypothetical protein BJY52DRAFT_1291857 [Lactarius psammicola]
MSQRIVGKVCVHRQSSLRNLVRIVNCRRDSSDNNKIVSSDLSATSFLSPFAITILCELSRRVSPLQPSHDAPSGWLAISAFVGLPLALWAYKCLMLIIFQRKVIYMGYAPPGSRTELLADLYPKYTPNGIHIEELSIPSSRPNRVRLSTLLLRNDNLSIPPQHVIVYLQGNAGNPLHRIPMFAALLKAVPSLAIVAPAPRSLLDMGLIADHAAALAFAASRFPTSYLTLYGHSLGASAALCLLAARKHVGNCAPGAAAAVDTQVGQLWRARSGAGERSSRACRTCFARSTAALASLPLSRPFVRDRWDARAAAHDIFHRDLAQRAMVLVSARDEVVPPVMGQEIFDALKAPIGTDGTLGRFVVLERSLHEDAWRYRDWSQA